VLYFARTFANIILDYHHFVKLILLKTLVCYNFLTLSFYNTRLVYDNNFV